MPPNWTLIEGALPEIIFAFNDRTKDILIPLSGYFRLLADYVNVIKQKCRIAHCSRLSILEGCMNVMMVTAPILLQWFTGDPYEEGGELSLVARIVGAGTNNKIAG